MDVELKTYREQDVVHDDEGWSCWIWEDPETYRRLGPFETEAEIQRAIDTVLG